MLKEPKRGAFDYLLNDPPPPENPERREPSRIRISIEILEQRRKANGGPGFKEAFIWAGVFLIIMLMFKLARGEEARWQENRVGNNTYWYNPVTGTRGQEWNMPDGSVRSTWQDQSGHVTDCVVQTFGNTLSTRCH